MSEYATSECPPSGAKPDFDTLTAQCGLPRAESRRLLAMLMERPLTWFIAHGADAAPADVAERFRALVRRRLEGEPLAYLLGEQEFHSRSFRVSPAVLIPRADTETLVEQAMQRLQPSLLSGQASTRDTEFASSPGTDTRANADSQSGSDSGRTRETSTLRLLELGAGSGIIAITLALELPSLEVHAVERSVQALNVARQNARRHGARIHWHQGSWWDALPADAPAFDMIVSNPPYIAADDEHLRQGDLRFEPPEALSAGQDGLDDLRTIIAGAPTRLKDGGWLLLEHGYDQEAAVQSLLHEAGFNQVFTARDLADQPRVSGGRLG